MKKVSNEGWQAYVKELRKLSKKASSKLDSYILKHGGYGNIKVTKELIDVAYGLVSHYGEGSAELACKMYEQIAELQGVKIAPAEPALTATRDETAAAINGAMLQAPSGKKLPQIADRLVKQAAADTTLKNAKRDRAMWAWIPSGDSCAFCMALASRGWQNAGKITLKGNHAEHIHANCDCNYAIRFGNDLNYNSYNPNKYKKIYDDAEGKTASEKIDNLRKALYEENKDIINASRRKNYLSKKLRTLSETLKYHDNAGEQIIPKGADIVSAKTIAGKGSKTELRVESKLVEKYGGNIGDWEKRVGKIKGAKRDYDVHWYEKDGIMYEPKYKKPPKRG